MNLKYSKKICNNTRTLDVGCVGYGNVMGIHKELESLNLPLLVGIDVNGINQLNRNDIVCCDIQNYGDVTKLIHRFGQFETIIMLEVIEHLGNIYDTVININRLLVKNGKIVLSTPNAISDKWIKQVKQSGYHKAGKKHIHWYDKQTITQLFELFGFKLFEVVSKDLEPRLIISFIKEKEV